MNNATRPLAVITGASSGIGYELAKQFASNGFDLLVTGLEPNIHEAAKSLVKDGTNVEALQANLASYDGVEQLYSAIRATGRPVEALAVNAGFGVNGPFSETELRDEIDMINLNVVSSIHLTKRVVKDMVAVGSGRILFTSSVAAIMPASFMAVYGATKAFLLSFSEALRNELQDKGVSVTALLPGPTDTEFFERANMGDTKVGSSPKDDPAQVAKQGFEALMAGKDQVLGGSVATRAQAAVGRMLPATVGAEQHRKMAEPGSAS